MKSDARRNPRITFTEWLCAIIVVVSWTYILLEAL